MRELDGIAMGSRLAGDIYHERFTGFEPYAYTGYRTSALDFFYLFSHKRVLFFVHSQGARHYKCGMKWGFQLFSHLSSFTSASNYAHVYDNGTEQGLVHL